MINSSVEKPAESQRRVIVLQANIDALEMQVCCSTFSVQFIIVTIGSHLQADVSSDFVNVA